MRLGPPYPRRERVVVRLSMPNTRNSQPRVPRSILQSSSGLPSVVIATLITEGNPGWWGPRSPLPVSPRRRAGTESPRDSIHIHAGFKKSPKGKCSTETSLRLPGGDSGCAGGPLQAVAARRVPRASWISAAKLRSLRVSEAKSPQKLNMPHKPVLYSAPPLPLTPSARDTVSQPRSDVRRVAPLGGAGASCHRGDGGETGSCECHARALLCLRRTIAGLQRSAHHNIKGIFAAGGRDAPRTFSALRPG